MKRFTETAKWRDPWYINLSGHAKLLWTYLTDNCDAIGLIHIDFRLVARDCLLPIKEKHIAELGDRVQALGNGRYFLPKFIQFQYGELSPDCPPHKTLLKLVRQHNLSRSGLGYTYPTATLTTTLQDKTRQEEDKTGSESGTSFGKSENLFLEPSAGVTVRTPAQDVLEFLNQQSGRAFRETEENLGFISARLKESGVTIEGIKTMIVRQCNRWLRTDQAEYLRPQTLFNATKFDAYYAAKDLPVHETNQRTSTASHQRATGADQRKVGIPDAPRNGKLSDLLANRARQSTANRVAAKTSPPERGESGGSTHG